MERVSEEQRVYPGKSLYAMRPVDECVAEVVRHAGGPLEVQTCSLREARGRVLAGDVAAPANVPPFPTSIMDGFAVRSEDGPGRYPVDCANGATAGGADFGPLVAGHVRYITTGSRVPAGADAVVKVEDTTEIREDGRLFIEIPVHSKPGANIRQVGSDTKAGEVVLRDSMCLDVGSIGLLASLGISAARVRRRPRAVVMSTGDELVDVAEATQRDEASRGQIVDCNRPLLLALLEEAGAEAVDFGIVGDNPDVLRARFTAALAEADIVVTSGGVSRGSKDQVKPLLEALGEVHVGAMCMKPGKPSTFATIPAPSGCGERRRLAFALPGNPVSCFVTFKLLVVPALEQLRGRPAEAAVYPRVDVELAQAVAMDPERPEYHRAVVRWEGARFVAESTGFQRSSRVASVAGANCFMEIPQGSGTLPRGTVVKALLLPNGGPGGAGIDAALGGYPAAPTTWAARLPATASAPVAAPPAASAAASAGLREDARGASPGSIGVVAIGDEAVGAAEGLCAWLRSRPGADAMRLHVRQVPSGDASALSSAVAVWDSGPEDQRCSVALVVCSFGLGASDAAAADALRALCAGRELPNVADLVLRASLPKVPLAALAPLVAGATGAGCLVATLPAGAAVDAAVALWPLLSAGAPMSGG